tara:strand:- start:6347 stop:7615 length:1269 start_codon:yes stop_codon:yes gene_type:complete
MFGLNFKFPIFTRNKKGDSFFDIISANKWFEGKGNMNVALNHPLLTPALLFVVKLFSQAELSVISPATGKDRPNSHALSVLKNPNAYQTLPDLLESLLFTQMALGVGVLYIKRTLGVKKPNSLYVLDYSKIEFPESLDNNTKVNRNSDRYNKIKKTKVVYDKDGENITIAIEDLLFFYDLPNGLHSNPYKVNSRIDGICQTLANTCDSEIAKGIIIKSNGKELITGQKDGFPLGEDEKKSVENSLASKYGLGWNRNRGIITKANIKWQSLHIIARDLGHDEGIKTDANIIFTALHIPSDVYSISSNSKSTYKNANASLVSYIQNEITPTLNSFLHTISSLFPDNERLIGNYNHLAVMLPSIREKYTNVSLQMKALNDARLTGIEDAEALEMVGLPKGLKLNDVQPLSGPANEEGSSPNNVND